MAKRSKKKNRQQETAQSTQPRSSARLPMANRKFFLLKVLTIVMAGLWIFWPAVHGNWLWDDDLLITKNELVHDPSGLWKIWLEPDKLIDYFPLTVSVEWMEWQLWQNHTLGYHLITLILHLINALLVWRLLDKFGLRLAWLGGLIFAIHPAVVESVAWISELKNTLSLTPFLLAMCAWIDYDECGNRKDYFLALGLFLTAMLCKTTVVMFPVVLLLYTWWKRDRIDWNDVKVSIPFFVVSLGLGLVTFWFLHHHVIAQQVIPLGGFFSRLALAGLSIAFYFSKCFLPVGLLTTYPKWVIDPPSSLQFLPWLVLAGTLYWLWTKRTGWQRHILLGLGFFLINLAPFIGFTTASYMNFTWVMDHLLYLPLIGLIGLVVAGMGQISQQFSITVRSFGIGIVTTVMGLLAWKSHGYAGIYLNAESLWAYTAQHNPDALSARLNLGVIYLDTGRLEEAVEQFQQILKTDPDYAPAHVDLGLALFKKGAVSEAITQYEQLMQRDPSNAETHYNLGLVLSKAGQTSQAIEQFKIAVKLKPDYPDALYNLGNALLATKQISEAIEEYRQAIKINPDSVEMHCNLGLALVQINQVSTAIEEYRQALRLDPASFDAHRYLATALAQTNQPAEAIEQFECALKINPNDAETRNNLGGVLGQTGRLPEAIEQFEQAIKLNPDYADALGNLGGALMQTGRNSEAIEQFELSLKINPNNANVQNQLKRLQGLQSAIPATNSPVK